MFLPKKIQNCVQLLEMKKICLVQKNIWLNFWESIILIFAVSKSAAIKSIHMSNPESVNFDIIRLTLYLW